MSRSSKTWAHLFVLLSVISWGFSQFMMDRLLEYVSPALLTCVRFMLSGLLLVLIFGRSNKVAFRPIYILTGSLGGFGYYFLMAYALAWSSVPFVAVMGGILPVVALCVESVGERNSLNLKKIAAALLSLVGIFFFSFESRMDWNFVALILMFFANVSWVLYTLVKKNMSSGNEEMVLGYEFMVSGFLSFLFIPTFQFMKPLSVSGFLDLLVIIFFATILPYWLFNRASKELAISKANRYLNLLPVFSLLPSLLFGDFRLGLWQMLAVFFLIVAAFL